jgi:uncharacterized protein (DUF4415 family)
VLPPDRLGRADAVDWTRASLDGASVPACQVDETFWRKARLVAPKRRKVHTGLRIDADVLDWFKTKRRGWQTRMNAILRSCYEHERQS